MTETNRLETALNMKTWAIVATASITYVGLLDENMNPLSQPVTEYLDVLLSPGMETHRPNPTTIYESWMEKQVLRIHFPMEYSCVSVPMQVDTTRGPQIAINRQVSATPLGLCLDIEEAAIYVTPLNILFFEHMSPQDRNVHKNIVRQGIRTAVEQRAHRANIVLPGR